MHTLFNKLREGEILDPERTNEEEADLIDAEAPAVLDDPKAADASNNDDGSAKK